MTDKYSPNWYWDQLGYTVHRDGNFKTIRRPDGSFVDIGDRSHADQLRAAARECLLNGLTDIGEDELKYLETTHD